jgi:hypothetical protein
MCPPFFSLAFMLHLRTFGGLVVTSDDGSSGGSVAQPRRLALLAVLARAGEKGISREQVAWAKFWPDDEEERSRESARAGRFMRCDVISATSEQSSARNCCGSIRKYCPVMSGNSPLRSRRGDLNGAVAQYSGPFLAGFTLPGVSAFGTLGR